MILSPALGKGVMKYAVGLFVFLWIMSGAVGAWVMGDLDRQHWDMVARGPLTLVRAINDNPVTIPSMN